MKKTAPLVAVLLLAMSGLLQGQTQDKPAAKPAAYRSSTSISFLLARGNNKALNFSFDTDQNFVLKKEILNFKGIMIYAKDNGSMTKEIYYTHLKFNHQLGADAYLLGLARFERNTLAGYPSRYSFSAGGLGLDQDQQEGLFSDLAVGWSSENSSAKVNLDDVGAAPLEKTINASFLSTILTTRLSFSLTPSAQFVQQGVVFINMHDVNDYRMNSLSSLSASFSRYFGLKMTIQVNYERLPVAGYKNTDVFLISSLVISI